MPLQKSGKYNDIPENLLPEIPDVPTLVTYEVAYSFIDPATKKKQWAANLNLPSQSTVFYNKKSFPIGLVGGVDINGNLLHTEIRRLDFTPNASMGLIQFWVGQGNAANDELYQYMEMMSENGSNPHRDTNARVLFTKKDFKAEAKERTARRELERQAYDAIRAMKKDQVIQTANLIGQSTDREYELIYDDLEDWARANPETFIALNTDPDKKAKTIMASGLASGAFRIDEEKMAIVHENGATIMEGLTSTERRNVLSQWAEFVKDNPNGSKILTGLQVLADKKK